MNKKIVGKKYIISSLLLLSCFSLGFVLQTDDDVYLKITRGLDIFSKVYREVAYKYVENVDPEEFMKYGIDRMLESLDPYTVFIDDKKSDEIDLITNGKYGGIGISVGVRDSNFIVTNVMEGFTAARNGIKIGDAILRIDSVDLTGKTSEDVRDLFRGEPGTTLHMSISRNGVAHPIDFTLTREEILLKNVSYSGILNHNIGYIRLEHFTRGAGEEVRESVKELKNEGAQRLVLDLRGNPGGLLDQAVEVVSQFVPRNSLIVSTHGRTEDAEHKYYTQEEPVAPDLPLMVLVNSESASASEIVAGALQDLDRALIVGTRTFGKGLVQTITPLPYNTTLKITTAKYYTPSGRCIQEINYGSKQNGVFRPFPDSTRKTFFTIHHRPVRDEGGIAPDSIVRAYTPSQTLDALENNDYFSRFFDANNQYVSDTTITKQTLYTDFVTFLRDSHFEGDPRITRSLDSAIAAAKDDKYSDGVLDDIKTAREKAAAEWEKNFSSVDNKQDRKDIETELLIARARRTGGEREAIAAGIPYDNQLQTGIHILENQKTVEIKLGLR
ncbi:MAG TPA: S41 family peptidase [Candidatus Kapabacteria bacterium]|nr:S41 family peptidase [Candidatus Kapabacteria bacterium]